MEPYGLTHQILLPDTFTREIPGTLYDHGRQLSMVGTSPIVEQPVLLNTWTTTWNTASRDNQTDDESK